MLTAQSGHLDPLTQCPLLGVKRTLIESAAMSASDSAASISSTSISSTIRPAFCRARSICIRAAALMGPSSLFATRRRPLAISASAGSYLANRRDCPNAAIPAARAHPLGSSKTDADLTEAVGPVRFRRRASHGGGRRLLPKVRRHHWPRFPRSAKIAGRLTAYPRSTLRHHRRPLIGFARRVSVGAVR